MRARGALVRQDPYARRLRIEHHARMSPRQEAPRHVAAHPAQANHPELHIDKPTNKAARPRSLYAFCSLHDTPVDLIKERILRATMPLRLRTYTIARRTALAIIAVGLGVVILL